MRGRIAVLALIVAAIAPNFLVLLASFALLWPASGAFVGLSQASLMDTDPARHEHLMARWTLAGSVGVVAGPLLLKDSDRFGDLLRHGWMKLIHETILSSRYASVSRPNA